MHKRSRNQIVGAAAIVLLAGLFFWVKLRLVTNVPRTTYADPPAARSEVGGATEQRREPQASQVQANEADRAR